MSPESISKYFRNEKIELLLKYFEKCPIPIVVESDDGEEIPIQKIYHVEGRAECVKLLIHNSAKDKLTKELEGYKAELKEATDEKDDAESELEKAEKELNEIEEKHEKELERIQSALDTAQEKLGFGTAQRKIEDQIDDLFEKAAESIELLTAEIDRLTVDNTALAWNIEQLESWKQNTLKAE